MFPLIILILPMLSFATEAISVSVLLKGRNDYVRGRVLVTGVVERISICPPCKNPGTCVPCPEDHLVLKEKAKSDLKATIWLKSPLPKEARPNNGDVYALWVRYLKDSKVSIRDKNGVFVYEGPFTNRGD